MLVGYARVSSTGQSLEVQTDQLTAAGCGKLFAEKRSGSTTAGRQALEDAIGFVREGDTLVVTRIDRLARSVIDLEGIVGDLKAKGVHLKATEQPIDTSTPAGIAFLQMLAVFAQFERAISKERQRDGIDRAMEETPEKYRGRRRTLDREAILRMTAEGMKPAAIARELGCNRVTVHKVLRQEREQEAPA